MDDTKRTLQVLLIARDPELRGELKGLLDELPEELRLSLHVESDPRRGVQHAIDRGPDLVLLELGDDVADGQRTLAQIQREAAECMVVVVYRPQVLSSEQRLATLLVQLVREGAKDFLRRPLAAAEFETLLRRHFFTAARGPSTRGRVLAFVGNKGGVGKSTISSSVACTLAREAPGRVLLIDGSLQHGTACDLLGLAPEATISDAARQVDRLDERLLRMLSVSHECGLRVLAAPPNAIDAAPVDDQAFARILAVARHAFDYVVVDTFPLIDSVTVAILDVADQVFVVLDDLVPTVLGTVELLRVLDRLGVSEERVRVVLNHANGRYRGRLKDLDVARRLGRDIDHVVPYSGRVLAATNAGSPYALRAARWWGFGRAVHGIVEGVEGRAAQARRVRAPADDCVDEDTGVALPLAEQGEAT